MEYRKTETFYGTQNDKNILWKIENFGMTSPNFMENRKKTKLWVSERWGRGKEGRHNFIEDRNMLWKTENYEISAKRNNFIYMIAKNYRSKFENNAVTQRHIGHNPRDLFIFQFNYFVSNMSMKTQPCHVTRIYWGKHTANLYIRNMKT